MFSLVSKRGFFAPIFFIILFQNIVFGFDNPFIVKGNKIINQKASKKIYEIGSEVKSKTGVSIYIYAVKSFGLNSDIAFKEKKQKILEIKKQILKKSNLQKPYVIIIYSDLDKYITVVNSEKLNHKIDNDNIRDGYIIPLVSSYDKNTREAKITAGLFNGYAEIADEIAKSFNVKLKNNISSDNKTINDIYKDIMYFLVISGLIAYFIAIRRQKKLGIS